MSTTLNLSAEISETEYRDAVTALADYMHRLGDNWCSSQHDYFAAIVPEYSGSGGYEDRHHSLAWDVADHDHATTYAARLANMRARILWYVRHGVTTLDIANNGFRAAGLPTYKLPTSGRFTVYFNGGFDFTVSTVDGDAQQWLHDNLYAVINAAVNGEPSPESRIIPGSVRFTGHPEVYAHDSETDGDGRRVDYSIQDEDTLRPSYS